MSPLTATMLLYRAKLAQISQKLGWLGHSLRQLDHVAAQRIRRTHQWVSFNSRIWPDWRLNSLLENLLVRLVQLIRTQRVRFLLSGSAAVSISADSAAENVDSNLESCCPSGFFVSDDVIKNHTGDIAYVSYLKEATLTCSSCSKRHFIDQKVDNIEYCECHNKIPSVYGSSTSEVAWAPFLERKDILVWRQEHPEQKGHYAYKMYGKFDDVSAFEFLEVQMDVSAFRLSWDKATAQCHIVEENRLDDKNVTQVYYWEVNWPRFFSNRDYVCGRRAHIFQDEKTIVVYSKSTEHESCPAKSKNFRVQDYWSVLTIKPFGNFDEMGIEFSLTAFENPGLSLPSSVTTWVAVRAMPDFMANLRKACLELRKWKSSHKVQKSHGAKEPSFLETPQYSRHQVTSSAPSVYA